MTMWARSLITRLAVLTPSAWRRSTSIRNTLGSTTTPCPMTHMVDGLRMPLGMRWNLYSFPPVTTVWPALLPPCERTTMSTRSASRSMTFPLPSSPHCPPTRMVTLIAAPTLAEAPEFTYGRPRRLSGLTTRLGFGPGRALGRGRRLSRRGSPPRFGRGCAGGGRRRRAVRIEVLAEEALQFDGVAVDDPVPGADLLETVWTADPLGGQLRGASAEERVAPAPDVHGGHGDSVRADAPAKSPAVPVERTMEPACSLQLAAIALPRRSGQTEQPHAQPRRDKVAGVEHCLRQARDPEEAHVEAAKRLRRGAHGLEQRGAVGCRDHRQAEHPGGVRAGHRPGQAPSPVVPHEVEAIDAIGVDDPDHVVDQLIHAVCTCRSGVGVRRIPAQVGRDGAHAALGQPLHRLPPRCGALRVAVEQHHHLAVLGAGEQRFKAQPVGLDLALGHRRHAVNVATPSARVQRAGAGWPTSRRGSPPGLSAIHNR